ncbi:MAG: hypothetical protein O7F73_20590 [Gammaproteobacteria bacterium]|nr:hypothetical protein [Gammaproteobacteria bacterium]
MAQPANTLALVAMGGFRHLRQCTPMQSYTYQVIHGHIIVMVEGDPCLLDTGSPFSVGYAPISIAGREFAVHDNYMDVCPAYLAEHIGTAVEGLIGTDILTNFTICIRPPEQLIEFSGHSPEGEILLPLQSFMNVPILPIKVNGQIVRAFFDTGAPLSYLLPEQLAGLDPYARQEDFYPLPGNFLTDVYFLAVCIGGEEREFRFGELPVELQMMLEAEQVQAIIGTELLNHFGLCFSMSDRVMRLDSVGRLAAAY